MSRVLVRLTYQSEYTESERFLSPLTVPSCSALPAGSLVDVGSLVRISSIILCGGFLLTFSFKKVPAWGFFLPSFFFAFDYQRKSGPGSCVPVRYAALSFASFPWADKEKKSIFAFSQKYFVILLILRKKRVYISLFFLKVPTECTPRPIEKCNCTFSFAIWIYETMLHI